MHPILRPLLAALALILPAPLLAEAPLIRLQTGDAGRDWMAVGKLLIGEREFCTGALIAPDLVLTAAHCLYDKDSGQPVAVADIRFLDGWRNGRAEAYRGVRAAVTYPGYDFGTPDQASRVARDLAILALDQPIRLPQVSPFALAPAPGRDAEVAVVSYAQDRADAPSLQEVCRVLTRQQDMLVLDCNVDFGSSGAPVFVLEEDGARIVSVISAKAEANGQEVALASAMPDPLPVLLQALAAADPRQNGGVRMLMGGDALRGGGAKVIRPATAQTDDTP